MVMDKEYIKSTNFFRLYNNVQLRLHAYLLTVLHNNTDTEEVLQETAAVLWEKFDQYQEGSNFGAWAISIARNKALQFMQKNKQTRQIFDESFYDKVSRQAEHSSSDIHERVRALQACLEKIPEKGKKLLSMKFSKEMSYQRISQMTGYTPNNLYQLIWKMMRALRSCIEKHLRCQEI
jgi:RNA polymerase sigma-70 factor (ECF subfamily)